VQYGRVKLFKASASGKEFVAHIAGPGNTLNVAALFGAKPHFLSAQCIEDTSILCVGREEFLSFLNKYPSIATRIIAIMGEVTNIAYEKIIDLLVEKVDLRVSNVLFMLSSKFGTTLSLTCRDIADIAGTTTESTIRVIGKLKKEGILNSHREKIEILDRQGFANRAAAQWVKRSSTTSNADSPERGKTYSRADEAVSAKRGRVSMCFSTRSASRIRSGKPFGTGSRCGKTPSRGASR